MRTAVYYPFTQVESQSLVRSALLMWDQLEVIVPGEWFNPHYADPSVAEAMGVIGVKHVASREQQEEAHAKILDFIEMGLPPAFHAQTTQQMLGIYPQKFLPETWEALVSCDVARRICAREPELSEPMAFSVMNILADCCAGKTKARVTDAQDAYRNITALLASGAEIEAPQDIQNTELLISRSVKALDTDIIPIERLIKFRQREEREANGGSLRSLRHKYADRLEMQVTELAKVSKSSDRAEVIRQFESDMSDDVRDLAAELGFASRELLFAKEFISTTLISATVLTTAVLGNLPTVIPPELATGLGAIVGVLGVLGTGNKFLKSRREILQRHPMAYLYEMR